MRVSLMDDVSKMRSSFEFFVEVSFLILLLRENSLSLSPSPPPPPPNGRKFAPVTMETMTQSSIAGGRDVISTSGRFVDLSGRGLSAVPANISGGSHWLSLRNNSISAISGSQFLFLAEELRRLELSYNTISSLRSLLKVPFWVSLRYLDLSHNSVRMLDRKLFERTPKLAYLDLSFNIISELEAECFKDLKILAFLSLSNNRIVHLSGAVFFGLSGLATIELDNNRISDIDSDVFAGLPSIETIFIAGNQISVFRTESLARSNRFRRLDVSFNKIRSVGHLTLTRLRPLTYVTFDGNDVDRLWRHDFYSLTVREISLCRLPSLSVVDEEAFYQLENLEILSLNENPRLVYIHPGALVGLDRLRVLDVHNSALFAVSETLVLAQASLEVLSISGNPLHCDCNVRWMSEYFVNTTTSNRNFTIDAEVVCDSPTERRGWPLQRLRYLPDACRPVVIPLFHGTALQETGSTAAFTCRAIGHPVPVIHWILPSGERINGTVNDTRVNFDPSGSVVVENLTPSDSGTFTCLASNPRGYDAASVRLSIYSNAVSVLVRSVSWNFVSVSWNGTESTISSANYVILHHPEAATAGAPRERFGRVQLRPYMRAFTVTNLDPGTEYKFCIACEKPATGREAEHSFEVGDVKRISCVSVRTKDVPGTSVGISTLLDDGLLAEVLSCATLVAALGFVLAIVVRLRGRRSYREPRSFRLEKEGCTGAQPRGMARSGGYVTSSVTKRQVDEDLMDELLQMKPVNVTTSRTSLLESYDV